MTYPQPSSNAYAVGGYKFFRLNTLLSSPGDIYESEQGGQAFALGPDSDIANVAVGYFDDEVADFVNQFTISPDRSWTGLVGARNDSKYAPSGRPGRILLWSADLYNPNYLPDAYRGPTQDVLIQETPRLDVVEYFAAPGALISKRNDKDYTYQSLPTITSGTTFVVIPYYGRKYASIRMHNFSGVVQTFGVFGLDYYVAPPTTFGGITVSGLQTTILTPTAIDSINAGSPVQIEQVVNASVQGMFDALVLTLAPSAGVSNGITPINVTLSDTPAG